MHGSLTFNGIETCTLQEEMGSTASMSAPFFWREEVSQINASASQNTLCQTSPSGISGLIEKMQILRPLLINECLELPAKGSSF